MCKFFESTGERQELQNVKGHDIDTVANKSDMEFLSQLCFF